MAKKIIIIIFLLFTSFTFSQTPNLIEKWNSAYERYDLINSNGTTIAYTKYNSLYERWETYYLKSDNSGYEIQQPQQSVNVELVRKTLATLQAKYDSNLSKLKNKVEQIDKNIDYLILEYWKDGRAPESLDYTYANHLKYLFNKNYVKVIEMKGYDYSSNSTTESIIKFFENGSIELLMVELEFYKEANIDHYNKLINKYKSLF